jgi:hypothetical protein
LSSLILPDVVLDNLELERALENVQMKRTRGEWLHYFDQALKEMDPKLSLVKAREDAPRYGGMIPGLWHVRRENGLGQRDTYLPIDDGNGNFVEPHMGILEGLRSNDMQRPGALDDMRKKWDAEQRDHEKRLQAFKDERMEEFKDRYRLHAYGSVSFADTRWKNSAKGRRDAAPRKEK